MKTMKMAAMLIIAFAVMTAGAAAAEKTEQNTAKVSARNTVRDTAQEKYETVTETNSEAKEDNDMNDQMNETDGIQEIKALYPKPAGEGMDAETFVMEDEYWDWRQSMWEKTDRSSDLQEGMEDYYSAVLKEMLVTEKDENTVCSPLNIYLALTMLAEVTGGDTRTQILNVLKADDMETLRSRSKALWDANYMDTPMIKSLPANSMWLRNDMNYRGDTLQRLAEEYYASSFRGKMGSEEFDRALREWTDENTGGLLSDYTKDMHLQPETVMAIVSTIYYKAAWTDRFSTERTDTAVFHGADGDTQVSMMHRDGMMRLYRTDRFRAAAAGLSDAGAMYFFLPEEGINVKDIACDIDAIRICRGNAEVESSCPIVHLSVPVFEVSKKTDLIEALEKLGITDALSCGTADFSPLTDEVDKVWLDSAEHAALVKVDEEGVTGAAYTEMAMCGSALIQEEEDFTLDRPFYFAIAAEDGSILFSGIVQTIG